jgi:hypothetical protein
MATTEQRKDATMAISFPAPEAAPQQIGREADERTDDASLLTEAGRLLKRGYERVCSAIFDPDGDCMRL